MNSSVLNSAFLGSDCVGRTIDGTFTLLQWLGGTEESSVFLTELDPDHKAAIKFIAANAPDAGIRSAQWSAAGALSHPHLVRVYGTGRCEVDRVELLYIVTEYADEVLSEILRERALTPAETRAMLDPVLDALSCLHGRSLVHGHLKPSNIVVVDNQIKLSTDRLHAVDDPDTSASNSKYDAPEIALGKISPASDVWSLGVVIGEVLTQRSRPVNGSGGSEPVVAGSIPPPFFGIVRECMRLDPARRCTLTGIREALKPATTAEPAAKTAAPPPPVIAPPVIAPSAASLSTVASEKALPVDPVRPQALPPRSPASGTLISRFPVTIGSAALVLVIVAVLVLGGLAIGRLFTRAPQQSSPAPVALQSSTPAAQPPPPATQTQAPSPAPAPSSSTPKTQPAPESRAKAPTPVPQPPSSDASAPPESSSPAAEPSSSVPTPEAQTPAPQGQPSVAGGVVKGEVASQVNPEVPQHIRDTIQGHVRVRVAVQVDASGNVADATLDSPGPSQYFANQALKAARDWKFKPAQVDGRAVASAWMLQFSFAHDGTNITPTETSPR